MAGLNVDVDGYENSTLQAIEMTAKMKVVSAYLYKKDVVKLDVDAICADYVWTSCGPTSDGNS